jgi:hypothetical protein
MIVNIKENWATLVLLLVPLTIATLDAVVLIGEQRQSEAEKAIRLVKESASRKEGFTVQQHLYATVYHRRSLGEPVTIQGWTASQPPDRDRPIEVRFSYTDLTGAHSAVWYVGGDQIMAANDAASDLDWR